MALVDGFGGEMCPISLQKALFLFCLEQENDVRAYSFVPYKYGCFSFQANQDISTLEKYGYLERSQGKIKLVKRECFLSELNLFDIGRLHEICTTYKDYSDDDFVKYTYLKYPFYAINSEIAEKYLSQEQMETVRRKDKRRTLTNYTLFTIGYEGVSLESYLDKLLVYGVKVLCDVRKNAYSQKYGFSKSQIKLACDGVGIRYIHIPELGIESDQRQALNSQHDYDVLFEQYRNTTLKNSESYLKMIIELIGKEQRVALTCFEKDVRQCHRTQIAHKLMSYPGINYDLKEI